MTLTAKLLEVSHCGNMSVARRRVRRICHRLHAFYGEPSLGNQSDPLDEIAFIVLSARTTETLYIRAFNNLKRRFPKWVELLGVKPSAVSKEISVAGLGRKRAVQLIGIYRQLWDDFGSRARAAMERMPAPALFEYLTRLPGVSAKSAFCVMMWSVGHDVFPADTHVARVMARLGFIPEGLRPEYAQRAVAPLVPRGASKKLHTALVLHGRAVCKPGRPDCSHCCIWRNCRWPGKEREQVR